MGLVVEVGQSTLVKDLSAWGGRYASYAAGRAIPLEQIERELGHGSH
jgi:hypothetical protein